MSKPRLATPDRAFNLATDLLCKRWTCQTVRLLLTGPYRFNELLDRIDGVSDRMLSQRLKELEAEGIVTRRVLPDPPVRVEYALTARGQALAPVIRELARWGVAHGDLSLRNLA